MRLPNPILFLFFCFFGFSSVYAGESQIVMLDSGSQTSLRGLSVVTDAIIWVSGSSGSVGRSTDSGKTFTWMQVKGYEKRDFRDIEAFDDSTAIIMAVAAPAIILKTRDGGRNWYKVFEDTAKGMFLDAMGFADGQKGIVIGDPINRHIFLGFTQDAGETWTVPEGDAIAIIPEAFPDEAFFAASGTNLVVYNAGNSTSGIFVTGGSVSRIFYRNQIEILPVQFGKPSTGANSIAIDNTGLTAVVVGGDYANDRDTSGNCVIVSLTDPLRFFHPRTPPHGYRSCVTYTTSHQLLTCGTSGVDLSLDGGWNWKLISSQGFNVCQKAKTGSSVFLAGSNGRIARLETIP